MEKVPFGSMQWERRRIGRAEDGRDLAALRQRAIDKMPMPMDVLPRRKARKEDGIRSSGERELMGRSTSLDEIGGSVSESSDSGHATIDSSATRGDGDKMHTPRSLNGCTMISPGRTFLG